MASFDKIRFLENKRVILVRFGGELGIKSRRTRQSMINHLRNDLWKILQEYSSFKILSFRDRLIVCSEDNIDLNQISDLLASSISGISSVSPTYVVKSDEESIISGGLAEAVTIIKPNTSFAVRVRREGNHSFSSMDIARKLGTEILSSFIEGIEVDLESPDFQLYLDIRGSLTFIYTKIYKGMDGIPSLSQGTAIALIRPNFNSIFAAWLMKKRGVKILPIFFETGKKSDSDFLEIVKSQFGLIFAIIPLYELLRSFENHKSLCLLCQLYCERICQNIAKKNQISVIMSSTCFDYNNETMTYESLKILEKNTILSVIRPILFGYYGQETLQLDLDLNPCCSYRNKVFLDVYNDFKVESLTKLPTFSQEL